MGERSFVLWKLTYIALCKSSLFWLRFSPFWANFFKDLLIWLIIVWQVCILGWVSDKYSYLLKPCCNYIFQVSILSISMKVMKGNDNLWTSLKIHYIWQWIAFVQSKKNHSGFRSYTLQTYFLEFPLNIWI